MIASYACSSFRSSCSTCFAFDGPNTPPQARRADSAVAPAISPMPRPAKLTAREMRPDGTATVLIVLDDFWSDIVVCSPPSAEAGFDDIDVVGAATTTTGSCLGWPNSCFVSLYVAADVWTVCAVPGALATGECCVKVSGMLPSACVSGLGGSAEISLALSLTLDKIALTGTTASTEGSIRASTCMDTMVAPRATLESDVAIAIWIMACYVS
mmetsp:Transcript_2243/g.6057  ORF Transcript_2243/g.6057 Transcript_2243/m.6057 type:complete len:212 (+) Transcript_2243:1347-1982(+)